MRRFTEVAYTLSGKCRVMQLGGLFIAEICVAPDTWAMIGSKVLDDIETAFNIAVREDIYAS